MCGIELIVLNNGEHTAFVERPPTDRYGDNDVIVKHSMFSVAAAML